MRYLTFLSFIFLFACEPWGSVHKPAVKLSVDGVFSNLKSYAQVNLRATENSDLTEEQLLTATIQLKHAGKVYDFDVVGDQYSYVYQSVDQIQGTEGEDFELMVICNGEEYTAKGVLPLASSATRHPYFQGGGGSGFYHNRYNFGYSETALWVVPHDQTYTEPIHLFSYLTQTHHAFTFKGTIPQGILWGSVGGGTAIYGSSTKADSLHYNRVTFSPAYQRYLYQVMNETDWKSNEFATIPANTEGNLSEGAVGFFYGATISKEVVAIKDLPPFISE